MVDSLFIRRHFDAEQINKIINHEKIYPWVRGNIEGPLDLTLVVANPDNYLLMGEHGGILFVEHQPGLYEAHTQVLPGYRGQYTLDLVNESLHWMFTQTVAIEVVSKVPRGNIAALALVRAVHGTFEFEVEQGWYLEGKLVPAKIFSWTIQEWMKKCPYLPHQGKWFHHKLEQDLGKLSHPEDPVHDRYVGAAVSMFLGGQPDKAVVFYNRWARMAGYQEISIVTYQPLVIDIRDAWVVVRDNDFWVMQQCPPLQQLAQSEV